MHSCLVRLQNAFGFFTTVAFSVGAIIALTSLLQVQTPTASLDLRTAQIVKGRPNYYTPTKTEYASLRFDLEADLSSLFGWNTKQVFVWVQATYPATAANATAATPASQAVIWDAILRSPAQEDPPSLRELIWRHPYSTPPPTPKKARKNYKTGAAAGAPAGTIHLRNQAPKYKFPDPSGRLAHRDDVRLELRWNIQPWVGALAWTNRARIGRWAPLDGGESRRFALPGLKGASAAGAETVVGKGEVPRAGEAEPIVQV